MHSITAAQSERAGNKHPNSRTAYHHVTFLNLYIDIYHLDSTLTLEYNISTIATFRPVYMGHGHAIEAFILLIYILFLEHATIKQAYKLFKSLR